MKPATRRPRAMTHADVRHFIQALARAMPDPRSELEFTDPYTLLISVVLSAQTTDAAVNRATETLFREASTPAAMVKLGVDGVTPHIRGLGLWQGKTRNVVELSRLLLERHGGEVPRDRAALEALPGVGRKTANVVLNVAFGENTLAVDTHIFRLGNRTGIAPGKTPLEVELALLERVPAEFLRNAHHWLILHGRYVCKARVPECWRCVGTAWCRYTDKTPVPVAAKKKQPA
jgi:endonuclease III